MKALVEAKEVSCFYGIVLGLNNVSFRIDEGITGIVGPNGAGKSTLMRLMTGQLRPSAGRLEALGKVPFDNPAVLARLGYCPEGEKLHDDLRPLDWLRGLASLSGISWRQTRAIGERALRRVKLEEAAWGKRMGGFSKGMKQRVKLAQALMLEPDLIILDEPMNGLDPMGRNDVASLLKEERQRGASIVISSHILGELEALCGRFVMMNWGRVMAAGEAEAIRREQIEQAERVGVRTSDPHGLAAYLAEREPLNGYLVEGDRLILWLRDPDGFAERWMGYVAECPMEVQELVNEGRSLASLFERMIR